MATAKVIVTGGNAGIGYEIVKALFQSAKPYHVFMGSRSLEKGKLAAETMKKDYPDAKNTIEPIQLDVTSDKSIETVFEHVKASQGQLDVLVHNAGKKYTLTFDVLTGANFDLEFIHGKSTLRESFTKAYDVNVAGAHVLTWTMMPLLLKSSDPRLLFVGGLSSVTLAANENYFPTPPPPAGWPKPTQFEVVGYRCSKTALSMLMLDWHHKVAQDGIKVWAVAPGFLATNLGGVGPELAKQMGAGDPKAGGDIVKLVVEGGRDADVGKFVKAGGGFVAW
ncbi:Short-chain dehydrogenase/reductase tropE [Lachnellula suecica]|uniref:Short-chain dehydrogenase/reductase tropE n=1 Tax=Lachnellula suecica TaxID=602035 RepID=A0A8T9CA93_9HELO|nr:Short-chain dehydrogenase/reductase tropE [Lachnellula suecica]